MNLLVQCKELLETGSICQTSENVSLLRAELCTKAQLYTVIHFLQQSGFTEQDHWEEAGSFFFSLYEAKQVCYLSFHEKSGTLRLILEENRLLSSGNHHPLFLQKEQRPALHLSSSSDKVPLTEPLLTQVRLLYYSNNCGMSYLIRLCDGRFAVIDGGMAEYDEPEHFLQLMEAQNIRKGIPEIAVWFITHAHYDHYNLFLRLMSKYSHRFKLNMLVYNWNSMESDTDRTEFERILSDLNPHETKIVLAHTGQRFCYPFATFHMLYTREDSYPDPVKEVNDMSLVIRMDLGANRVLWTGDIMEDGASVMTKDYAPKTLSCDILQVAHHGYWGASDAFYHSADPTILLWPCPNYILYRLGEDEFPSNHFLLNSPRIRRIFVSGREEVTLDLSSNISSAENIPCTETLSPKENIQDKGNILYEETFSHTSPLSLGWCTIRSIFSDYKAGELSLQTESCRLTAGNSYSVYELVQYDLLENIYDYSISLKGHALHAECIRLFFNYGEPEHYSPGDALDLSLNANESFDLVLTLNSQTNQAVLTNHGKIVHTVAYIPVQRKGLFLILRDSEIILTHVKIAI